MNFNSFVEFFDFSICTTIYARPVIYLFLQYKANTEPTRNRTNQCTLMIQFLVLNIFGMPCEVDSLQTFSKDSTNNSIILGVFSFFASFSLVFFAINVSFIFKIIKVFEFEKKI